MGVKFQLFLSVGNFICKTIQAYHLDYKSFADFYLFCNEIRKINLIPGGQTYAKAKYTHIQEEFFKRML